MGQSERISFRAKMKTAIGKLREFVKGTVVQKHSIDCDRKLQNGATRDYDFELTRENISFDNIHQMSQAKERDNNPIDYSAVPGPLPFELLRQSPWLQTIPGSSWLLWNRD